MLYDRIRRVIAEPKQVVWAFDQDAWSKALDYDHLPLAVSRNIYGAVREGVLFQARVHHERRVFECSESGL